MLRGHCRTTHWQGTEVPPTPPEVAIDLECNKQQPKCIQHSQSDLEGKREAAIDGRVNGDRPRGMCRREWGWIRREGGGRDV